MPEFNQDELDILTGLVAGGLLFGQEAFVTSLMGKLGEDGTEAFLQKFDLLLDAPPAA